MILKILARAGALAALLAAAPMAVAAPVSGLQGAGQDYALRPFPDFTDFAAFADLTGLVACDAALILKVHVPEFGAFVPTFQVFGAGGNGLSGSQFALIAFDFIGQPTGCAGMMCDDHTNYDFPDFFLSPGPWALDLRLLGQASGAPDAFRFRRTAYSVNTNKGVL